MRRTAGESSRQCTVGVWAVLAILGSGIAAEGGDRRIAVTVDDLPVTHPGWHSPREQWEITNGLLRTLKAHRVPAIGFVNENKLEEDGRFVPERLEMLRRWLDAGMELGNHGYSHLDLHRVPVQAWEEDVLRGQRRLGPLLAERGEKPAFFRHPFLHTGSSLEVLRRTRAFLAESGYRVAPVTLDNSEWVFGRAYVEADSAAERERLGRAYLEHMRAVVGHFEAQTAAVVGRPIPHILLIHAYALNADWLGELLAELEGDGYRFVSLAEALEDPAYRTEDGYHGAEGLSWIYRWALEAGGSPETLDREPGAPPWVWELAGLEP